MRTKASAEESGSERTCIVTGVKDAPEAMLRFALDLDGTVVPDIRRKLPGRGVWTRLSVEAVRRAAAKGAFSRAFRAKADPPLRLAEMVDALLERDALQALSMVNKAGLVLTGAFKVDAAIEAGGVAALIQASDGARDGAAKREQGLRAKLGPAARNNRPHKSLLFEPIEFGIGEGKCGTCCAQNWSSEFGLSRKGGAFASLSRERGGRDRDRQRRRAGRQRRRAWPAGRIG